MHFCSVLRFVKTNHCQATFCLSFTHLLYSAPLLYITFLFYSVLRLYVSLPCPTSPMRYISLHHIALLRFSSTSLCETSLYFAYAKPLFTLPMQNSSAPFLHETFLYSTYANSSAPLSTTPLHHLATLCFAVANHYPAILHLCFTYHNYNQPCRSLFRVVIPYECPFFSRTFFANCI